MKVAKIAQRRECGGNEFGRSLTGLVRPQQLAKGHTPSQHLALPDASVMRSPECQKQDKYQVWIQHKLRCQGAEPEQEPTYPHLSGLQAPALLCPLTHRTPATGQMPARLQPIPSQAPSPYPDLVKSTSSQTQRAVMIASASHGSN